MKKLFSICLFVFLALRCNGQEQRKPKYGDLTREQLNLAFKQASTTVKTGKILSFAGLPVFTAGLLLFVSGVNDDLGGDSDNDTKIVGGYVLVLSGLVSTLIGVPV